MCCFVLRRAPTCRSQFSTDRCVLVQEHRLEYQQQIKIKHQSIIEEMNSDGKLN